MAPRFLSIDDVLVIHHDQITHYGGSVGLRDRGSLESALAQPQMSFGGQRLHGDLFEMAAAYLFHIVMNHPFVDGNKRTGTASALAFLFINGYDLDRSEAELANFVLSVAGGQTGKAEVAVFLRENSQPLR